VGIHGPGHSESKSDIRLTQEEEKLKLSTTKRVKKRIRKGIGKGDGKKYSVFRPKKGKE